MELHAINSTLDTCIMIAMHRWLTQQAQSMLVSVLKAAARARGLRVSDSKTKLIIRLLNNCGLVGPCRVPAVVLLHVEEEKLLPAPDQLEGALHALKLVPLVRPQISVFTARCPASGRPCSYGQNNSPSCHSS